MRGPGAYRHLEGERAHPPSRGFAREDGKTYPGGGSRGLQPSPRPAASRAPPVTAILAGPSTPGGFFRGQMRGWGASPGMDPLGPSQHPASPGKGQCLYLPFWAGQPPQPGGPPAWGLCPRVGLEAREGAGLTSWSLEAPALGCQSAKPSVDRRGGVLAQTTAREHLAHGHGGGGPPYTEQAWAWSCVHEFRV